jgi:CheY-like chemotaxis protein
LSDPALEKIAPLASKISTDNLQPPSEYPLILLAEDNQTNIDTFSSYLDACQYRLIFAKNGQEAIDMAQNCQPDLILMDIQMPLIDGLEAIVTIRQNPQLAKMPIVALTALAMDTDKEKCLAPNPLK